MGTQTAAAATAALPTRHQQRWRVGAVTVTKVTDLLLDMFTPAALFPDWQPELLEGSGSWLSPDSMDAAGVHALMSVHSWVLTSPGRIVVIDTGVGDGKERPHTPVFHRLQTGYLDRLRAAGVAPEDVDHVLLTHLHVDHVGWNTRLVDGRWVPTFPNARYHFSARERAWFTDPANHSDRNRNSFLLQPDSIAPVIDAGQAEMIAIDGREVVPGLSFHPTPGHSPDHASIRLRSEGVEGWFVGDLLHHPIQIRYPELNSVFDAVPAQARASRRWALEQAADSDALVFTTHFPESSVGRVTRDGDGFRWAFL
ncbi:MBL fold metallo-hydrolase [Marinibaculum pumilum]|uniref:MBL fold metallo-hydrolase n=1 Tax=Marinibaculum pumilum TaxID=1766165 RepID=A0ABV7L4T1_9PROT